MWIKNIKAFIKHLANNKLYTIITVLGFTISLTFVILLSVYVAQEMSVNSSQKNKDRIFRYTNEMHSNLAPPIGAWLQSEIPEIESFTRIYDNSSILELPNQEKLGFNYLMADSTFFDIFSFQLLEGNKATALKTRNSVVLTKLFANKLFGEESPIGKEIKISDVNCQITGIIEDISRNSHFEKVDAVINFRSLADFWDSKTLLSTNNNCSFDLYFLAKPNTNFAAKAPLILELFKKDFWLYKGNRTKTVVLEPLEDVYFSSISGRGITQNSKTLVSVLSSIVLLILILAIINYINLTIAQSGMRVKEIAIKKLVGSSRMELIVQHVSESIIFIFLAFLLALFFSFLAEPVFNNLLKTNIHLSNTISLFVLISALIIIIAIGFVSGIIPALIITKLKAVEVIKGGFRRKSKRLYSRILIGFQYTVVIILLISTMIISKQTDFLLNHQLGFNTHNIIWMNNNIKPTEKNALKNELSKIPGVKAVSYVAGSPLDGGNNQSFVYKEKPVSFQEFIVDSAFFKMMKIKIIPTGTAYSANGIYLNKTAVNTLGLDSLPQSFELYGNKTPVLGVVNDFHFKSLRNKIGMVEIKMMHEGVYPWNIFVELDTKNTISTIDKIKKTYLNFTNGMPFDYGFVDETISKWYDKEKRTSQIVSYFAILTIIISVMGIFAMSIFYNQQRSKEIGIRKVNGANVWEIIQMLNKDFIKWVIIAFIIASPIAYYAMNKWLQNYAYRTEISWWIFLIAGMSALLIALITVSWQTFIAARKNPVEALRYE